MIDYEPLGVYRYFNDNKIHYKYNIILQQYPVLFYHWLFHPRLKIHPWMMYATYSAKPLLYQFIDYKFIPSESNIIIERLILKIWLQYLERPKNRMKFYPLCHPTQVMIQIITHLNIILLRRLRHIQ